MPSTSVYKSERAPHDRLIRRVGGIKLPLYRWYKFVGRSLISSSPPWRPDD